MLLVDTLQGKLHKEVPYWFMRQAGRYLPEYREVRKKAGSFLTLCYSPELASEVTLQPIRRFDLSAAIIFSDILVIPHAMGLKLEFKEGEGPLLETLCSPEDIVKLKTNELHSHLKPVYDAVSLTRQNLAKEKALIGFAGAPWTLACYMLEGKGSKDFAKAVGFGYKNAEAFTKLLDMLADVIVEYLSHKIKSGANVVQLFDSWAGLVPNAKFDAWVIKPHQKIVTGLKRLHPEVPIIGFARGVGGNLAEYTRQVGVNGVGVDQFTDVGWAKSHRNGKVLQGNLDPSALENSKFDLLSQTEHILETWADIPFVFNLGHGIHQHTPIDHVEAMCDRVRSYKRSI